MADAKITCINKPLSGSHEHITHVGNPEVGWIWTVADVVKSIDANQNTFYVLDPSTGKRANVGVIRPSNHAPYLRTYADGNWSDNLLSLPRYMYAIS
ncbi:DUF3892 domain-containing protein [Methylotenera versatilis]|uniref:DUF3892 domain-containing protein n=1 Tax=Methylotenera versatilis (strain 301) TaxID=666681 RepID=D7DP45_METV0|nr:DUF3892 domain-containing protein [Methylotenera versatilis]ADI31076.1 conserved hypothetical protein [Methylotenera versatilis 301]